MHLIALVGCMGVRGAADGLRAARESGDENTEAAAGLWLDHRFAMGPTGTFWELQGRRVDDWKKCPACGKKKLKNKRGVAIQCLNCGTIFADPDFQPTYSMEADDWGLMTGHKPWRPMTGYEMKFWGVSKPWLAPPRGFAMPFPMMHFEMLGEDMSEYEE